MQSHTGEVTYRFHCSQHYYFIFQCQVQKQVNQKVTKLKTKQNMYHQLYRTSILYGLCHYHSIRFSTFKRHVQYFPSVCKK